MIRRCNGSFKLREKLVEQLGRSLVEREVMSSMIDQINRSAIKVDTVLPTAYYCCDTSKRAVLSGCNDVEMGPGNSLHASVSAK